MPFLFNFDPKRNLHTLAIDKCDFKEHGFLGDVFLLFYSTAVHVLLIDSLSDTILLGSDACKKGMPALPGQHQPSEAILFIYER